MTLLFRAHADIVHDRNQTDLALAKAIGEALQRHYHFAVFSVGVDSAKGMAWVQVPDLDVDVYWIRLKDLASDPGFRKAVMGAGELLERYGVPRDRRALEHVDGIAAENPLAFMGVGVPRA
jgi:hypothetical protein